jgi:hypothetical protein
MADKYLLENGTDAFLLEDGTGVLLKETTAGQPTITIREALFGSIAESVENFLDDLFDLLEVRRTGKGGQMFAESKKILLSGREEKEDYVFADPAVLVAESNPSGVFPFDVGEDLELADHLRGQLIIHKRRGTPRGLSADIKRLCNTTQVSLTYHPQTECGWILGVTSPGFSPDLVYDLDTSLTFLGLDNMVDIVTENRSNRTNAEVTKIIRKEFMPARLNIRTKIFTILGIGVGPIGEVPIGGLP